MLEAGIVSEETYVEQGLYCERASAADRVRADSYSPDLALIGYPVTDEFQHQFLGLVTPAAARRRGESGLRRRRGRRHARRPRRATRGLYPPRLRRRRRDDAPGAAALQGPDLATFVSSDHGFAPQFAAIDASKVLVDLGLLRGHRLQLPPGDGRDDRQGQGLLGRRRGADLPQPRRPRPGARASLPAGRSSRRGRDRAANQGCLPGARGPERLDRRRRSPRAGT